MRRRAEVVRQIRSEWHAIVKRSGVSREALRCFPSHRVEILGASVKTLKGDAIGILTAVGYMSPHSEAFAGTSTPHRSLCPKAGECGDICLGHNSGMLSMSPSKRARLWKTALFLGSRSLFGELIDLEVRALERKADRLGMVPAVRFDGSSDTGYGAILSTRHPNVRFYDYTKVESRLERSKKLANYHLTYSWSEKSRSVPRGFNVAVVFDSTKSDALPARFRGRRVISGDETDARFMDPSTVAVGLYFKAAADRDGHRSRAERFLQSR